MSKEQDLEDIFIEPEPGADTEPDTAQETEEQDAEETPSPEELGRLLEDARSKADSHWDTVLRLQADLDNLKKRHQRDLENAHKFALEKFVSELLGVWDSLELGYQAAQEENADVDKLREGTELTLKMLRTVMNNHGVEQIDPQGQAFDPERHQAIAMEAGEEAPANTVLEVIQKGYSLNGRLVRPAMVKVAQ